MEAARAAYLASTTARSRAQPIGRRLASIMICARLRVAGAGVFPTFDELRAWLGRSEDSHTLRACLGSLVVRGLLERDGTTWRITEEGWRPGSDPAPSGAAVAGPSETGSDPARSVAAAGRARNQVPA